METTFSSDERARIYQEIRRKYARAARSLDGLFQYPTGRSGLEGLGYDPALINRLPEQVVDSYCGVGNPFSLDQLRQGETVLDIGSGGGVDTFVAGFLVGPAGCAVGIDAVPEMLERARQNHGALSISNVTFLRAAAEDLPFRSQSFHAVISNGVFNLIPDKRRALFDVFRVLKEGGRLMMADQLLTGPLPEDRNARVASWAG